MNTPKTIVSSYDSLSEEYEARIADELEGKPLDRDLLRRLGEFAGPRGPICDLGCGPGHVAGFLANYAADLVGVDISPRMVEVASKRFPAISFQEADFSSLPFRDQYFAGIAAFYSLIHLNENELVTVLGELRRVLLPEGLLVASFHLGAEPLHVEELWGIPVLLDYPFLGTDIIKSAFLSARFVIEDFMVRDPYPKFEHPSVRAYVVVRPALD